MHRNWHWPHLLSWLLWLLNRLVLIYVDWRMWCIMKLCCIFGVLFCAIVLEQTSLRFASFSCLQSSPGLLWHFFIVLRYLRQILYLLFLRIASWFEDLGNLFGIICGVRERFAGLTLSCLLVSFDALFGWRRQKMQLSVCLNISFLCWSDIVNELFLWVQRWASVFIILFLVLGL